MKLSLNKRHIPTDEEIKSYLKYQYSKEAIDTVLKETELSYNMEKERYDSLVSASARVLTAVSILLVSLSTLYKICMENIDNINVIFCFIDKKLVTTIYFIIFILLFVSLLHALFSQYRFSYQVLGSPTQLLEVMKSSANNKMTEEGAKLQFILSLVKPYHSLESRNDRIMSLLKRSVVFAGSGLIIALFCILAALCLVLFA